MSDMSAGGTATPGGTARPEGSVRPESASHSRGTARSMWAVGGMIFAAALLVMNGIWQILLGIAAIAKGSFFVAAPNYLYNDVSVRTWGWIHLVIGAVMALTGFFLFSGATWARAVGITLAVLSAIANFFFLPYYPIWSLAIIALDVFVIWALATVRRPEGASSTW
jgi:hypothetical protein